MTNNAFTALTVAELKRAVAIKERIEELESELASVLGDSPRSSGAAVAGGPGKRRKMSAAGRARIAAAARARWAKVNAAKGKAPVKRKRTMSPAARAKIAAAARARWARVKAAKK
jgi:hypothetical protein